MSKKRTIEEMQQLIDSKYGEGEWTILEYEGLYNPCSIKHKCGKVKHFKQGSTIRRYNLPCPCTPSETRKEFLERVKIKKEDFQKEIDSIYGEGVWKIVKFTDMKSPITLEHNCGAKKNITRPRNLRKGTCTCECELKMNQ